MRIAHVAHVGHGVQRYLLAIRIIRYFDIGKEVDSDPCVELSVYSFMPMFIQAGRQ